MITPKMRRRLDILLADDGSQHALAAVELLRDLPFGRSALPRSTITVLEVIEPVQAYDSVLRLANLEQACEMLKEKPVTLVKEMATGHPAEVLIEYADRLHPDLLVLGVRGRRAPLGILVGGVSQQVVEYADWPVLVVSAPYQGLRKILLVVDGSEDSRCAAEYLAKFPLPARASVKVMSVLSPPPPHLPVDELWAHRSELERSVLLGHPIASLDTESQQEEQAGQAIVDQALKLLKAEAVKATGILARGDAATEIIEYVRAHKVDLIVAGRRGLSGSKRWLLGSVTRKLVHYAGCSVLVMKGRPRLLSSL